MNGRRKCPYCGSGDASLRNDDSMVSFDTPPVDIPRGMDEYEVAMELQKQVYCVLRGLDAKFTRITAYRLPSKAYRVEVVRASRSFGGYSCVYG